MIRVLVVEDNADDIGIIRHLLAQYPEAKFKVIAADTTINCLKRLEAEGADLLLLDYRLPGEDGLAFLRRLSGLMDLPPVIVMTGQGDERVAVEAMRNGAFDYLRKDALTSRLLGEVGRKALERFRLDEEESRFDEQIMVALAAAAEGKDATTAGHLHRLAHLSAVLGQELGLGDHQLQVLRYGTVLHDIGKLAVSTSVLRKPGPLSDDEWEEMRQHPVVGDRICGCLKRSSQVRPIIRHHHEYWDGTGYPDALAGPEIPFLARVVAVVDAFDAMTTDRPYRKALPPAEVLRRLAKGAGKEWDPDITHAFLDLVEREGLDPRIMSAGEQRARAA
ncbi:MAG: hypothetical protein A2148_06520 [Chloroflexi bacterium RBG_16_68_14]|nr:MAG: hypothetical protein A2148_06520 [Chloroflexi bacterium RBG_16_68_14]